CVYGGGGGGGGPSKPPLLLLLGSQARIEDLNQATLERDQRQLKKRERQNRRHNIPETIPGEDRATCKGELEHNAPVRARQRHNTKEHQRGLESHGGGDTQDEIDRNVAHHVGQNLAEDDMSCTKIKHTRSLNIIALLDR